MDKYPMTPEGRKKLELELKELREVKRPANVKAIEEAAPTAICPKTRNTTRPRKNRASSQRG